MIGTGAALLASAAIGAGASIYGSSQASSAADKQYQAAMSAAEEQRRRYEMARNDFAPYMTAGTSALSDLQSQLPYLNSPVKPLDQAGLEATPGYQFTREQGLRAAQNALTSTGLGRSGAAVKAATRFGTGLADQTYMNQANYVTNLELANRNNTYNRLMGLINSGQNATAQLTGAGTTTGQGVAGSLIGGGNAQAGGIMAGTNMLMQGANNIGGNLLTAALLRGQGGGQQQTGMYGSGGWKNPDYFGSGVPESAWYNNA